MRCYKKWLYKFLLCNAVAVVLMAVFVFYTNSNYLDLTLAKREYLLDSKPKIIFAGDSRAQRQLIPRSAEALFGLSLGEVVNIGIESGDVVALDLLMSKYPETFNNATVIVSVSANEVNEGARELGYYPPAMISRLTLLQQLETFFPAHTETLKDYYWQNFKSLKARALGVPVGKRRNDGQSGYKANTKILDIKKIDAKSHVVKHPWYKDWDMTGHKATAFRAALKSMSQKAGRLIVFSGPISPTYLENLKNTNIYTCEKEFDLFVAAVCREYGITYLSYWRDSGLRDEHFHDPAHLNDTGAKLFTAMVMNVCRDLVTTP